MAILKADIKQHFDKLKNIRQSGATIPKNRNIFQMQITTILTPPGVSKEAKSFTEFEFGSLVR